MGTKKITNTKDLLRIISALFIFPIHKHEWSDSINEVINKHITDNNTDNENVEDLPIEIKSYIEDYHDSIKNNFPRDT